jgi:hypothetical protein
MTTPEYTAFMANEFNRYGKQWPVEPTPGPTPQTPAPKNMPPLPVSKAVVPEFTLQAKAAPLESDKIPLPPSAQSHTNEVANIPRRPTLKLEQQLVQ